MKLKRMPVNAFEAVLERQWCPVELSGVSVPSFLQNLPPHLLNSVYASGTRMSGTFYSDHLIPSGELIGGIDVYRNAPDDPVALNKDWYPVVRVSGNDTLFLVTGPWRDAEHWIDKVPERLKGADVVAVPAKKQD
jgi:hypothetical protein